METIAHFILLLCKGCRKTCRKISAHAEEARMDDRSRNLCRKCRIFWSRNGNRYGRLSARSDSSSVLIFGTCVYIDSAWSSRHRISRAPGLQQSCLWHLSAQ